MLNSQITARHKQKENKKTKLHPCLWHNLLPVARSVDFIVIDKNQYNSPSVQLIFHFYTEI